MRQRNGDRNLHGGDRAILDRGYGTGRRGSRWLPDRWYNMPGAASGGGGSLVDGNPVSSWADSSGNGHTATQTGSARPIFKTGIIGGKPVVRFASASSQVLTLASTIPATGSLTFFVVMKPATPSSTLVSLASTAANGSGTLFSGTEYSTSLLYTINNTSALPSLSNFHIFTNEHINAGLANMYVDGTVGSAPSVSGGNGTAYSQIGLSSTVFSDGDIAEIIAYSGALAIRAKLALLLGVLITTGQIPSTAEADALLASGDLVALEAYLIEHGVPVEQARDTVEPMAAGDRANIEAYLSAKYGIAVTSGGTPADPSTVAGLLGWYKADSLG